MKMEYPVLVLIGIFTLQTILIMVFLPLIWSIARVELIYIRVIDQAVKALFVGGLSIIWLFIFRYVYYLSYHRLKICGEKG